MSAAPWSAVSLLLLLPLLPCPRGCMCPVSCVVSGHFCCCVWSLLLLFLQGKIDVIALTSPNDGPITFPAEPEAEPPASPSEGEGVSESKGGEEGDEPPVVVAAAAAAAPLVAEAEAKAPVGDVTASVAGADGSSAVPLAEVVVPASTTGADVGTPTAAGSGVQESKSAELVEVTLEYAASLPRAAVLGGGAPARGRS